MKRGGDPAAREYLLSCLKATPRQRLDWLEEAIALVRAMPRSRKKLWIRQRDKSCRKEG